MRKFKPNGFKGGLSMFKKRVILVALVAIMAISIVGMGAVAYFTDNITTAGAFSSGVVDISKIPASKTFSVSNMIPGEWTSLEELSIYNSGSTTGVKYRFSATNDTESLVGFGDKINVMVRHTFAGTPNPSGWPIVYQGKLKNLNIDSMATPGIISGTLGTNITHQYYYQFQLDSSAGNQYQGQNASFTVTYYATQSSNPGWSE
jgi:predicted ribosomally synthesized peptide with SipW-like signal peptide